MIKIAIFADIHSNYLVFKKALEDAKSKNVDLFLFLGDYITDGFGDNKILDTIRNLKMYAIIGNREQSIIDYDRNKYKEWHKYDQYNSMLYSYNNLSTQNLEYIKTLEMYKIIELEGKKICMSHSKPNNLRGYVIENSYDEFDELIKNYDSDIFLFGHEHRSFCTKYKDKYFINPGSIGIPANGLPYSYGILEIDKKIKYEKIGIDYSYEEIELHYKNSEYYKVATLWCELLLKVMKDGYDYTYYFIEKIKEIAKDRNIDVSEYIPNDLFNECYEIYIKNFEE